MPSDTLDFAVYSGSEKLDLGPKRVSCLCRSEEQARHMAAFWGPHGYYERLVPGPQNQSSRPGY